MAARRAALGLAVLAAGGGCHVFNRVALALRPGDRGWFAAAVRPTDRAGVGPDSPARYAARFAALGTAGPGCSLRANARGPALVLVPGAEGEGALWREALPAFGGADPAALYVFRYSALERRDALSATFARGVAALRACPGGRTVLVVAHGEGGVLAAFAAAELGDVDAAPAPAPVVLVTVAAPLAGFGRLTARRDGAPRSSLGLDVEAAIPAYPAPAPGIRVVALRTRAPADPQMRRGPAGYEPNALAVVPAGALNVDLPSGLDRDDALLYAAHAVARGRWRDWLEATGVPADRPERGVCRLRQDLLADGDTPVDLVPGKPPAAGTTLWDGAGLPLEPPDPHLYVRCRPCDCNATGVLEPYPEWAELNARAYRRLRGTRAPYPVAVVPGFHGGGIVARARLAAGLDLLQQGWVAALVLSGGHRRGGRNEARHLVLEARRSAAQRGIDVEDRLFVEPCATRSLTNLRNSLRLMAAMGLRFGLFVTDAKMTGQAFVFYHELDELVSRDLGCALGRVAYLAGDGAFPRVSGEASPCAPPLSWRSNPVTFLFTGRRPSVFWISPFARSAAGETSALACTGGAPRLLADEPDDGDPLGGACLPARGERGLACTPSSHVLEEDRRLGEDD